MRTGRWYVFHFIGHAGFDPAAARVSDVEAPIAACQRAVKSADAR